MADRSATATRTPTHGKSSTYKRHGCRCDACREAWNTYMREYNHRTGRNRSKDEYLADVRATPPAHGTESRYIHHGCRCELCRSAANEARSYRLRRAANGHPGASA